MKSWKRLIFILIGIGIIQLTGCTALTHTVSLELSANNAITKYPVRMNLTEEQINIEVTYGMNQYAKTGKTMRVKANVTSGSKGFEGYIKIQAKGDSGKSNFLSHIELEANSENDYEFEIPVIYENMPFNIVVLDNNEHILQKAYAAVKASDIYNIRYVGFMNKNLLKKDKETKGKYELFSLNSDNLTDVYENLNVLDYIILSESEKDNLTEYQSSKIDEWLHKGGTIIINKKDYNEENDKDKECGFGRYLFMPHTNDIDEMVDWIEEVGPNPKLFFDETVNHIFMKNIHADNVAKIPNIVIYCVLFLTYIIIIGPLVYVILRKIKHKMLYWRVIPVLSIVFIIFVYLLGDATRVKENYIRFMNIAQVAKDGYVNDLTYLAAVNVNRSEMDVQATEGHKLKPVYTAEDIFNRTGKNSKVTYNFDNDNRSVCKIVNPKLFDPVYVHIADAYQDNQIKYHGDNDVINCDNYRLSGTYTNTMGKKIEHAFIISSRMIVKVGCLDVGQTVNLDECEYFYIPSYDTTYKKEFIDNLKNIINCDGEDIKNNLQYRTRLDISRLLLEDWCLDNPKGNFLVAFTKDSRPTKLALDNSIKIQDGVNMVIQELTVNYKNSKNEVFNAFGNYKGTIISGEYYEELNIINSDTLVMDYKLGKGKIKRIEYSPNYNIEFSIDEGNDESISLGFWGTVYFYNRETDKYDKVILSGEETVIKDLEKYLNKDNVLRVRYEIAQSSTRRNLVTAPVLTTVKEEE